MLAVFSKLRKHLLQGRIFYGWWLAGAGMIGGTMSGLFLGFGFSAFFLPIQEDLGASRVALSAAFSLSQLEAGIAGPLNGYLIDRLGPRKIMTTGYLLFGVGFLLMSLVQSIYTFYAAYIILAIGSSLSGFLPISAAMTNWFRRRRAIAVGISGSGEGLGGILVPLLALSIVSFGWRTTAMAIAPIVLILGLVLASFFYSRPEDVGLLPDGDPPDGSPKELSDSLESTSIEEPSFTTWQALRTSAFWLVAAAHSLTLVMVTGVNVHQIPAFVSAGLSLNTAAIVLSVNTACTVVGRLVFGFLGDYLNRQYALAGCFLLQAVGILVLAFADSLGMALVFAVLYGFAFGGRGPLLISIRGDFFGRRSFATIMGMSQTVLMVGTIAGPVFAGWVYDTTNSYSSAFLLMAAINIFAIVLLLAARKPVMPSKAVESP